MKTRVLLLTILIGLIFGSCANTEKLIREGRYDEAINIAVRKLTRNPDNEKQIKILQQAYPLAVKKDMDRIKYLQMEGQPDRWDEIYNIYLRLKNRQDKVEPLTPLYLNGKEITFEHRDYNRSLIEAKNRAADYHYAMAQKLMSKNDKFAYRQAYEELKKVKYYSPASDVEGMMRECLEKGTSYVLIVPVNHTIFKLPKSFMYDLVNLPIEQLNTQWIRYYNKDVRNGDYDLIIKVVLKKALVSGNNEQVREYEQKRKIQDGYEYKLDSKGNIMKDSTGKPIKVPKYRYIRCHVREVRQSKTATIEGIIDYTDNYTKQSIQLIPIKADNIFENIFATVNGDMDACSDEVLDLTKYRPVHYPNSITMITGAKETLKDIIWKALQDHRTFVEQNF